jgi:hypothetical protein
MKKLLKDNTISFIFFTNVVSLLQIVSPLDQSLKSFAEIFPRLLFAGKLSFGKNLQGTRLHGIGPWFPT